MHVKLAEKVETRKTATAKVEEKDALIERLRSSLKAKYDLIKNAEAAATKCAVRLWDKLDKARRRAAAEEEAAEKMAAERERQLALAKEKPGQGAKVTKKSRQNAKDAIGARQALALGGTSKKSIFLDLLRLPQNSGLKLSLDDKYWRKKNRKKN